jgi:YbbR domain-containing protein
LLLWKVIDPSTDKREDSEGPFLGTTRRFRVPITVRTAASDPRGFRIQPSEVDITLRGERQAINELDVFQIDAFVNLVNVAEARDLHARVEVRVPTGLNVRRIEPEEVSVERLRLAPQP